MIIQILCIIVLLMLLVWQKQDIMAEKEEKRYSIYCIVLTLAVVLAEIGCSLTDNSVPQNRAWSILFNVVGFGLSPFVFLAEPRYYCKKQKLKRNWFFLPAVLLLFLVLASPYTGWIFFVTKECVYFRGPLFILYLAVFTFSVAVNLWYKIRAIRFYPRYLQMKVISGTVFMLSGLMVQVVIPKYLMSWMIIAVYLVFNYALTCETGSMTDGLTGLMNRAAFNRMSYNMEPKKDKQYYVVMLDVNNFKEINDTKGHAYGDFCLREIAAILTETFRTDAHVFRYGGDEFTILMWARSHFHVEEYLARMLTKIAERQRTYQVFPEIAAGYEKYLDGKEFLWILERADDRMYQNKQSMKKREGGLHDDLSGGV